MPPATSDQHDAAHVVLLGASNVTLGFPRVVAEIRNRFPGRVQILAAHGHGRSYGQRSWAPFRTLPGIRTCGLWGALIGVRKPCVEAGLNVPLYALATDIGNDLLYGASPETIDQWVNECAEPLKDLGARLTLSRPPVFALQRIGRLRYLATRTFFFPKSPLTYERMLRDVPRLDELISARAATLGAACVAPQPEWYGFDPIHIRGRWRQRAWQDILGRWFDEKDDATPVVSPRRRHWLLEPAERTVFGAHRTRSQPAFQWGDGSGIWLY